MPSNTVATIVGGAIAVALIAAVVFLTWHGSVEGQAAMTFFGTIAGGAGVAGVGHVATKTGARAAKKEEM